jgi:hypothetical protein
VTSKAALDGFVNGHLFLMGGNQPLLNFLQPLRQIPDLLFQAVVLEAKSN